MAHSVTVSLVGGDVVAFHADVLVLKFARYRYGLDQTVASLLARAGVSIDAISPDPDETATAPTRGAIASPAVVFVGTAPLNDLRYDGIERLVQLGIEAALRLKPRHIALTMHGAGYGLDEEESAQSVIAGLASALRANGADEGLQCVSIVEFDDGRRSRIGRYLAKAFPALGFAPAAANDTWQLPVDTTPKGRAPLILPPAQTVAAPARRRHAFVAMPFSPEFEDIYFFAIQQPLHRAGFLSERADHQSFTGDVLLYVKDRIRTADFMVADLTGRNPNVYLEVGYAWGVNTPTILLLHKGEDLLFDVRGQRCLVYEHMRHLEEILTREIVILSDQL